MGANMVVESIEKTTELKRSSKQATEFTKVCPRCGALLFEDMHQCFGCLYDFERDSSRKQSTLIPDEQTSDIHTNQSSAKHLNLSNVELALKVCTPQLMVSCPIPQQGLSIGRGSENDVVICDRMVSRRHVRIFKSKSGAVAEDQGATNPALVDGELLVHARELHIGSTLDICGTTCVVVALQKEL